MSNNADLIPGSIIPSPVRPCWCVYNHEVTIDGVKLRPGVWFHDIAQRGDDDEDEEMSANTWLCGPLHVEAISRNVSQASGYGYLLHFRNIDGKWLQWVMPSEMLAGRPDPLVAALLDMGLEIDHRSRAKVQGYIASQKPKRRVTAVTTTGWQGPELFITPSEKIGQGDAFYQADSNGDGNYSKAGTLDGWREDIAAMMPGNPILQLAIGTALAGPLLAPLDIHTGGGFHLLSDSSNGKTTAVLCAASVWGHGARFTLKWKATANGLEGIASLRNDTLLALDELGLADPRYVGDVVYSVADGIGKQRAGRTGAARTTKRWRVMLLSSGEITLETKMAEAGKRTRAGQDVRLVTVSAGRKFGAWDDLHGHPSGASLSDALTRASSTYYGHAGPEFVRQLIAHGEFERLPALLETIRKRFSARTGQTARVAERFAITALALELATGFGLLPLAQGQGTENMVGLFDEWQTGRGEGPSEDRQILKAVADFIDRHGGSRFQSVKADAIEVRDRAGYWESTNTGRLYLFNRSGLEEATKSFELARVVRALDNVGAITKKQAPGKYQAKRRLPDGSTPWLYFIDPARLAPDD
ncbi:DUF927 domain-containing protein [Pseudomonas sp. AN-1]|uniref:DUF927 domain-containing protein n=1 Tax=Pseudomonas sp. AN-1 TaxID=3096605 RepID=UPI002A6A860C|nr:DUF927 domain-containing protein [Pseudomonas sp. AN-1]WPP44236.1 DUF927 domain-containing protein [Pseudomonas sp. AN-1]